MRTSHIFIPALILFLFASVASGAQDNLPEPDDVDIYDVESGVFLDEVPDLYSYAAGQAYKSGDYELAAQYYLSFLKRDQKDCVAVYNLACCYGLLGEAELASEYVYRAVANGFDDMDLLETDPDFDLVRDSYEFQEAMTRIDEFIEQYWIDTDRIFLPCEAFLPCHINTPEDYDPGESYDLVVGLHGEPGSAYFLSSLYSQFDNPQFIMANLNAPYAGIYGNYQLYNWDSWRSHRDELPPEVHDMGCSYIENSIRQLAEMYNADRVFLFGFSAGGTMAYRAALQNPDIVDGLIVFAGKLDEEYLDEDTLAAARDLPVFIGYNVGEEDALGYATGVRANEILESYGYDLTYYDYSSQQVIPQYALFELQAWMTDK